LRAWIAAFAVLLLAPAGAAAQDLDALRGTFSGPAVNWAGVYLGAQVGVSSMNTDFSSAGSNLVANMLANSTVEAQASPSDWPVLTNSTSSTSRNYGLFFGYNTQMEQLVLGFDLNYNYNQSLQTSDGPKSFERVVATTDGTSHDVKITSQASLKLIDYATARFRAGYAFGQFLPYAVIGAAAGRFNYAINVSLTDTQTDSNGNISVYAPAPESNAKNNAIVAGFVAGLGMDVALAPNIFLRGEWEFINFASIGGIRSNMNSGRVGIGVKF
jgi:opacity protein-like surface antigen